MNEEKEKALKELLLDIDCLDALSEWTDRFNIFDVLKITRTEIRHSNMLAWLLDPNENHGLGDKILKGVIQFVIKNFSDSNDVFKNLLMDFHSFVIQRETYHIDLIALSEKEKMVLCIENKIDSEEHDNQLQKYKSKFEEKYPDYQKMYIFLSPQGVESSDPENWFSMSYGDVFNILKPAYKNAEISQDAKLLIGNYIKIIEDDIMNNEELTKICRSIYNKHKEALDLIFENRPDRLSEIAEIIKKWASKKHEEGTIIFDEAYCTKTEIRFRTLEMNKEIPDSEDADSDWKTKNHYFYVIGNKNGKISISLLLNGTNKSEEQNVIFEKIKKFDKDYKGCKEKWQWRSHFRINKFFEIKDDVDEIDNEKFEKKLDEKLFEILKKQDELISVLNQ